MSRALDSPAIDRAGLAAAIIAAIGWATPGLFVRALDDFSAMFIVVGRCAVALAAAVALILLGRDWRGLFDALRQSTTWMLALLMGLYYALSLAAFMYAPIADVALLITLSPPFALAWRVATRAPVARGDWFGTALAVMGVAIIMWPTGMLPDFERRWIGDLLALAGAATMAVYAIGYANLATADNAPDVRATTALSFALTSIILGSYCMAVGQWPDAAALRQPGDLLAFAGLGLIATITPSLLYSVASARLPSVVASASRLLTPVMAAALAAWLIAEWPAMTFWPGSVLVLGGLGIILRWR